jgi:CelD/BcsL family acetyltransferase involved in cellulose biosynthesis
VSLRARLVSVADLGPGQVSVWRDLVSRAAEPNPFFEPDYLRATVRYRGVTVTLVTVFDGDDLVACLPLYSHERMSRFRLPVWGIPNVLGIPHVDPAYADMGLRTAIEFLSARWGVRRILRLHRVPADGAVGPALLAAVDSVRCSSLESASSICPLVKRRSSPTYLDDTLQGRTRRKLGQKRRNFERVLGERLRLVDRGSEPLAVERFLALEAAGWKGDARTAMLSIPGEADFFRAVCSTFAAGNRLRLLSLEAGDTTVAMRCDVLAGDRLFSLKATYDEHFARFSPGLLLEVDSLPIFHDSPAAWLYSATNYPDSPAFLLYPDRQVLVEAVAIFGGLTRPVVEKLAVPALRGLRRKAARFDVRQQ